MQKNKNRVNCNLLATFLLSKAFLVVRYFLFLFANFTPGNFPYLYETSSCPFFLLAPLLYLYIKSLCYKNFTLKKVDVVHSAPFLFFIVLTVVHVHLCLSLTSGEVTFLQKIIIFHYGNIFWALNFVQILFYIIAMLHTIYIYQTKLKNLYSSVERINLNWLVSLLTLIILHWLFIVSRGTLSLLNVKAGYIFDILDLFSITIFLVFVIILVYKGLTQLKIFSGIEEKSKYADTKLTPSEIEMYIQKLKNYMKTQQLYLIPSLTIDDLSKKLSIPSWYLSQVINDSFNQNFFNFINKYRVEEAKRIFMDSNNNNKTILQILFEAGFNSKSTFNSVFKKHTGMTPSEFKKSYQN
jgi:AraC-like DNA-binding protein